MKRINTFLTVAFAVSGLVGAASGISDLKPVRNGKIVARELMSAPDKSWQLTAKPLTGAQSGIRTTSISMQPRAVAESGMPILHAAMVNSNSWGGTQLYGIYSFTPGQYSFDLLKQHYNFNANGGAGYIGDNNYLTVNYEDYGGWLWVELHAYDTTTWQEIVSTMGEETDLSTCFTYSGADHGVYGCYNNDDVTGYIFAKFDTDNFTRSRIADLDEAWIACGAAADGTIYAVTSSGKLVSADTATGIITEIGDTGITSEHLTSGAIDPSTGVFYVASCNDSGSALHAVNIADASTHLVYEMPDGEELMGMYVAKEAINQAAPAAVTELDADFAEHSLEGTVSFRLSATTVGGAAGSGTLTYAVSCDGQELATGSGTYSQKITANVKFEAPGTYELAVAASNDEGTGPVSTISVTVTADDFPGAIVPPYSQTFDTQGDFDTFTVVDANQDAWTYVYWANRQLALCQFSMNGYDSDDYLVSPAIKLEKGKSYKLSCDFSCRSAVYEEAYEIVMGTAPEASALGTVLLEKQQIKSEEPKTESFSFTPESTGVYYLAIHCVSPKGAYGLCVDNFNISAGVSTASPAAPLMVAAPDANGALLVNVDVTAPSVDVSGKNIDEIDKLYILRDGEEVKVYDNVTPGQVLATYTDNIATDGYHTYQAYASNKNGGGQYAESRVYVGINYPAPPRNVKITETEGKPGEVTMTWDAPETDHEGNPINPDLVTYMIAHRMNGTNLTIVKRGVKGTSYTFQALNPDTEAQKFVTYLIFSETERGVNDRVVTATQPLAVGRPLEMPYHETFGGETLSPMLMASSSNTSKWTLASNMADQDGDGKYLLYESYVGATGTITTGKIAIEGENPEFSFWYFAMAGAEDEIVVSADDGTGFKEIGTVCIGDGNSLTWVKASIPVKEYVGKNVQFKLSYRTVEYRLGLDNISVEDARGVNLSARAITVPNKVNPGVPFEIKLYMTNNGAVNPGSFNTELYRDGVRVSIVTVDGLEPYASTTVVFNETLSSLASNPTSYVAVIDCPDDVDNYDNFTASVDVDLVQNDYPVPTNLVAENEGNLVRLSWNAPEVARDNISVTDDVEAYPAFSTGLENTQLRNDNIGYWTTINADGEASCVMQLGGSYLVFPNANTPTSFMVFDAEQAGVPERMLDDWRGHNGSKQCFMVMTVTVKPNDKWLISPLLSGNAQTISFFAKTPLTQYGLESFELLCSADGKEISDFVKVGEASAVPGNWTKYSYELPAGTKYFAIRSTSNDVYALLVDDISFEKAHPHRSLELLGYTPYRNSQPAMSILLTDTEHYMVETAISEATTYNVTAVYKTGESAPSNNASISLDSMDGIDAAAPVVEGAKGCIVVRNANNLNLQVSGIDGVVYYSGTVAEDMRVVLRPGVYVVNLSGNLTKVLVK